MVHVLDGWWGTTLAQKPETKLSTDCMRWVRDNGGIVFKIHGGMFQAAGLPDLTGALFLPDGTIIHFWIELKLGSNKPTKIQIARLETFGKFQYTVGVAWSLEDFILLIQNGVRLLAEEN